MNQFASSECALCQIWKGISSYVNLRRSNITEAPDPTKWWMLSASRSGRLDVNWTSSTMLTSCHRNACRSITGPLWGESTDDRWIPLIKGPYCRTFFVVGQNKLLSVVSFASSNSYLCFLNFVITPLYPCRIILGRLIMILSVTCVWWVIHIVVTRSTLHTTGLHENDRHFVDIFRCVYLKVESEVLLENPCYLTWIST